MTDSNKLAEARTDWAEDRTVLANERTFAGWMRTGMASVAVAIGLKAVFGDFEPTWIAKATASIFIAAAILIFIAAARQSIKTHKRLQCNEASEQPSNRVIFLTSTFILGSIAIGAILWLL